MESPEHLRRVAQLIQLAVAPVFLLMAVATTLTMLLGRLARVIDRRRDVEASVPASGERQARELALLERRGGLIYRALVLGVSAAALVSGLMTLAFAGQLAGFDTALAVAALFMAALFSYTAALLCLLREVFLAMSGFSAPRGSGDAG